MRTPNNPPAPLCKIDWYSFTVPTGAVIPGNGPDSMEVVNRVLSSLPFHGLDACAPDGTWRMDTAKGFYLWRATHLTSGLAVSWGSVNAHVFIELGGSACDYFRHTGSFAAVVKATAAHASRVDAAIDLQATLTPGNFVKAGHAKRFQDSHGHVVSKQGETFYVGNRKSDRCARVYRYAAPHPRAAFLRVETETKGMAARALAVLLAEAGELEGIRASHAVFEWKHKALNMDFLALVRLKRGYPTSLGMGSTGGFSLPSSRRYNAINRRGPLT